MATKKTSSNSKKTQAQPRDEYSYDSSNEDILPGDNEDYNESTGGFRSQAEMSGRRASSRNQVESEEYRNEPWNTGDQESRNMGQYGEIDFGYDQPRRNYNPEQSDYERRYRSRSSYGSQEPGRGRYEEYPGYNERYPESGYGRYNEPGRHSQERYPREQGGGYGGSHGRSEDSYRSYRNRPDDYERNTGRYGTRGQENRGYEERGYRETYRRPEHDYTSWYPGEPHEDYRQGPNDIDRSYEPPRRSNRYSEQDRGYDSPRPSNPGYGSSRDRESRMNREDWNVGNYGSREEWERDHFYRERNRRSHNR